MRPNSCEIENEVDLVLPSHQDQGVDRIPFETVAKVATPPELEQRLDAEQRVQNSAVLDIKLGLLRETGTLAHRIIPEPANLTELFEDIKNVLEFALRRERTGGLIQFAAVLVRGLA